MIELKKGKFKPEYAGKMNFYLNVVDDHLKTKTDAPSIGLILCQDRNHIIAEYALSGMDRPIGVSEYELTRSLPKELKSSLPTVEEIETELKNSVVAETAAKKSKKSIAPRKKAVKKKNGKR